jgi:hypothetical protein
MCDNIEIYKFMLMRVGTIKPDAGIFNIFTIIIYDNYINKSDKQHLSRNIVLLDVQLEV